MDLNKVMLIWRATTDLEVKKIWESQTSVVNFNLATNRRYKNSEWNTIEEAEFHKCVAFGNTADLLANYAWKGKRLYLEGRLRTRKWEDTNWNTRYSTEIVVENFIFLDAKWSNQSGSQEEQSAEQSQTQEEDEELPF